MQIKLSLSRVARILFLVFKAACMLIAVLVVACMILTVLLGIGLAAYQVAGWTGVVTYILAIFGLAFLCQYI